MTTTSPGDAPALAAERDRLLGFAQASRVEAGGFGWLTDVGTVDPAHDRELWITCRMTHVFALATLLGDAESADLVDHGLAALTGLFADPVHGGWFSAVDAAGRPTVAEKAAYPHAFVILATASAAVAGRPGAHDLLDAALATSERHFWDDAAGMSVESYDLGFTRLDAYRGVNANMHTVEAYLAAADALDHLGADGRLWRHRAARIARRVASNAEANGWRVPEHYDERWRPDLEFNRDRPADPFKPYGATVGHGIEWARLLLHVAAAVPDEPAPHQTPLPQAAAQLFQRALSDGWAVDGADGFVYTTDWSGQPVVHQRMHWVVAEAINTAAAFRTLADPAVPDFSGWYDTAWNYVATHLIDRRRGSWHHELDAGNQPSATVWPGKPDIYHAYQATLIPLLPLAPTLAVALAQQGLA